MEDKQIVDLFLKRQEDALTHMQNKYKRYAGSINMQVNACNINMGEDGA